MGVCVYILAQKWSGCQVGKSGSQGELKVTSMFIQRPPAKGVGCCVADSHTGNHLEDDFTLLETIRRSYSVIREKIPFELEGETFKPKREMTYDAWHVDGREGEFNDFLALYPVLSEYHVILPKSDQTDFDAPLGSVAARIKDKKCKTRRGSSRPPVKRKLAFESSSSHAMRSKTFASKDDALFLSISDNDEDKFLEPEVQPIEVIVDSGESPKVGVFVVHLRSVAARIKDKKCKTRRGSSRPPVKRKLAFESSSSHAMRSKTFASKDDALFLSISDNDEDKFLVRLLDCFELKDANACHLKIFAITPPAWKCHLDNQIDLELLDLYDPIMCSRLWWIMQLTKEPNPAVLALWEKISSLTIDVKEHKDKARLEAVEASLHREIEELTQDRRDVVSKVVPYAAMELVHSDELGRLFGKLVSSTITYGCCRKDHTQASNDFATATFPLLDEFVADVTASIETLLSKKPPMLHKPAFSRTQMLVPSSQKPTLSFAPSSNSMSPTDDLIKLSPFLL
nr:hypothetical protein [Tanacetum cinerariifolium]